MAFIVAEPCIGVRDTVSVDVCPVECIHPKRDEAGFAGERMLFIYPVKCIDHGACVPVCPVAAIYAEGDLPDNWNQFVEINANHYLKQRY
jgi:NAD-dependent dihydropyrimidine dehydrogenase PreA subunit